MAGGTWTQLAGATAGTLYQGVLLFACVMAFADHLETSPRLAALFGRNLGRYPERANLFRRVARPWVLYSMIVHGSAVVLFLLLGDWQRSMGPAFHYVALSFLLFFLIPAGMLWQTRVSSPVLPVFRTRPGWRRRVRSETPGRLLAALLAAPVGLTVLLVLAFPLRTGARVQELLGPAGRSVFVDVVFVGYLLVSAAVAEEFVFRHYLFNRLAALKKGPAGFWAAAVVTSLLFCLGHGAMVSPEWLKYVQVFVLGICLCVCQARLGTEACIVLHLAFNFSMILVVALTRAGA